MPVVEMAVLQVPAAVMMVSQEVALGMMLEHCLAAVVTALLGPLKVLQKFVAEQALLVQTVGVEIFVVLVAGVVVSLVLA